MTAKRTNGTRPGLTTVLAFCLLGQSMAIRQKLRQAVVSEELGIFDRMMLKMNEKEDMYKRQ